jgi:hypothetical protein
MMFCLVNSDLHESIDMMEFAWRRLLLARIDSEREFLSPRDRSRYLPNRIGWITLVLLCSGAQGLTVTRPTQGASYDQYHIGLEFVTTEVGTDNSFVCTFAPYPLDGTTNFVSQGGTGSLSADEVHRQVAMAVEDAFRAIDTGNPDRTVAIAIHDGKVNPELPGRRLNIALSQLGTPLPPFDKPPFGGGCPVLLGQAKQGAFGSAFPQDGYAAGVYLNHIDGLGDVGQFVIYDTLAEVVNGISGTTAHEVGHIFGAVHVTTTAVANPQPLMAHEDTGLPTSARFTPRRFDTGNANTIRNNAGNVAFGDFNFDKSVDAADIGIMFANWELQDRLFHEGDANKDHLVDAADAGVAFANWSGDPAVAHAVPEPQRTSPLIAASAALLYGSRMRFRLRTMRSRSAGRAI